MPRIGESDHFNVGARGGHEDSYKCGGSKIKWFPKIVDRCKWKNPCCARVGVDTGKIHIDHKGRAKKIYEFRNVCNDESNLKPSAEVEACQAPLKQIRPRLALANIYKPGDFVTAEEIVHAKACHTPKLDSMYGTPVWKDLKERDLV